MPSAKLRLRKRRMMIRKLRMYILLGIPILLALVGIIISVAATVLAMVTGEYEVAVMFLMILLVGVGTLAFLATY